MIKDIKVEYNSKTYKKRKKFLGFGAPYIGEEEIREVVDTIRSGWWTTGPKTHQFEEEFKNYVGSKHAIAVNSATAGLHTSLTSLGIGPGDEVITTPLTFVASANVIIHCGAKPVFADVEKDTWNIDPREIEKKITKKTRAILPVHLHGRPCRMDEIMSLAKKHKLFVVEDAAHAVEAIQKGKKVGSIGHLTAFSFYVTKNVATGEGGMITTNIKRLVDKASVLRLHGLSRDAWKRYSKTGFSLYEAVVPGYKYNLTDIASSLGLHQLRRVEKNLKIRKQIWDAYSKNLSNEPLLTLPSPIESGDRHAMHLFAVLLDLKNIKVARNEFVDMLIKENIGSGVHFSPVHTQPIYRKMFGYKKGDFPIAEFVGERIVSLPIAANLTEKDVKDVVLAVKKVLRKVSK